MGQKNRSVRTEHALFIAAGLLILFTPPVTDWWARAGLGWLLPYALWAAVIAAIVLAWLRGTEDEP